MTQFGDMDQWMKNRIYGDVAERLIVTAWKAEGCKRHAGSNPAVSAKIKQGRCDYMRNDIKTYQQLSALIEAILLKRKMAGKAEFTSNYTDLYKCFWRLKENHPNLFKRLSFDTNGHVPISTDLDEILFDFKRSGIIDVIGDRMVVSDSAENRLKKHRCAVSNDVIDKIVQEFDLNLT